MKNIPIASIAFYMLMPFMARAADPEVVLPSPYQLNANPPSSAVLSEPGFRQQGMRETNVRQPPPASWKWSLAPLVASQTLDIASSYGMRELNPLLAGPQGEFGVRAATVKVGVTVAFIGLEYLIVKAHPRAAKMLTTINWSGAALTSGFAIHNFSIR